MSKIGNSILRIVVPRQGGIVSPILANVYLHELDLFMDTVHSEFNRGKRRRKNNEYHRMSESIRHKRLRIDKLKQQKNTVNEIQSIKKQILNLDERRKTMSAGMPFDENYKRFFYCRYADDFVVGIIGSKQDAMNVQEKVKHFLQTQLHLTVSPEKSKIVHSQKGARFLGYDIKVYSGNKVIKIKRGDRFIRHRSVSEQMQLHIPQEKLREFCSNKRYGNYDKFCSMDRPGFSILSDAEIVLTYNAEMRGLANYYGIALNASRDLNKLVGIWRSSLFKTLARKHKTTVTKIANRLKIPNGGYALTVFGKDKTRVFKVFNTKDMKREPFSFGKIDIIPNTRSFTLGHSELIRRITANQCEYCGNRESKFEVHHVRALKDLKEEKKGWQILMAKKRRKTLVLCVSCHKLLHAGKLPDRRNTRKEQVESRIS